MSVDGKDVIVRDKRKYSYSRREKEKRMSISAGNRNEIKSYILELIEKDKKNIVANTIEVFGISATTVYRYIKKLMDDQVIGKDDNRRSGYRLNERIRTLRYYPQKECLEEDRIFYQDVLPFFRNISDNSGRIWNHSFTEIMNNAVEHAQSDEIICYITQNELNASVMIRDNGIGIFNKIVEYNKNVLGRNIDIDDAILELFAGKFTTDSQNHSGEGIFFTSRLVDQFYIYSEGRIFSHDSYAYEKLLNIFENEHGEGYDILKKQKGTIVMMTLSNNSRRNIEEVLNSFSDPDRGFFRTQISLKSVVPNGDPVSRSQAKRLYSGFDKFEEVEIDFADVDTIGQAFTHELFIVFQRNHPQIKLIIKNANEKVENMIKRVKNTI